MKRNSVLAPLFRPLHVFVDAENLSVERLPPCHLPENLQVTIILGKTSVRERWERRFEGAPAVLRIVKMHSGGPNAMDFLLAFYVGEAMSSHAGRVDIAIVSCDKGFDPLVQHLVSRSIRCRRVDSLEFLPIVLHVNAMTFPQRVEYAVAELQALPTFPRAEDRCLRILDRVFHHCLPGEALDDVLRALLARGAIRRAADGQALIFPWPLTT
jgi:hypothetical protein